jgi:hypothetical protein
MRLLRDCPVCFEDVEFEQLTVDEIRCWHCGAWLEQCHDCNYAEGESWCDDYLLTVEGM